MPSRNRRQRGLPWPEVTAVSNGDRRAPPGRHVGNRRDLAKCHVTDVVGAVVLGGGRQRLNRGAVGVDRRPELDLSGAGCALRAETFQPVRGRHRHGVRGRGNQGVGGVADQEIAGGVPGDTACLGSAGAVEHAHDRRRQGEARRGEDVDPEPHRGGRGDRPLPLNVAVARSAARREAVRLHIVGDVGVVEDQASGGTDLHGVEEPAVTAAAVATGALGDGRAVEGCADGGAVEQCLHSDTAPSGALRPLLRHR
jgi:hypothetical protein